VAQVQVLEQGIKTALKNGASGIVLFGHVDENILKVFGNTLAEVELKMD